MYLIDFFIRLINSSAPLLLAGIGALISDLSGTLGIFIEGFMITGAFFGWVLSGWTGSVFLGVTLCAIFSGLAGWILARFVRFFGANPFIAGLAINLAASGVTLSLSAIWFGTKGVLLNPDLQLPSQLVFTCIALLCAIAIAFGLKKTILGQRLRASGFAPVIAAEKGIHSGLYMEGAWALAALLASLAGAALTFRVGAYSPGGIAGRGWIALAAVYLGFRKVWGVALAAIVFSLAEQVGYNLQGFSAFSGTALLGLPSALALAFYLFTLLIRRRNGQ